ncbi:uncharacterized protein K02A2.6-like [Xenia sp. Carnegie-2017]|uniref:uncharacterized protein K02A2.6-like n=1 Tax=Xenia sp. Carnegie-2017 TaxID=2897299 RepID=UPI001F04B573|nr:uncharacterized protein K02A2.6-like [Xenia sp. Carnegie-2017]
MLSHRSWLRRKDDKVQINTLVYAMGGNTNDLLKSFQISERDMVYGNVVEQFASHFVGRSNTIFERARFNKRIQGEKESVIDFVEDLYKLAETCQFGTLKDELIRDRIVVGIQNANLSQRLMQDDKLTLEKAIRERQRKWADWSRKNKSTNGNDTTQKSKLKWNQNRSPDQHSRKKNRQCSRCGRSTIHKREDCPANNKTCLKCNKQGHFAAVCRSNSSAKIQSVDDNSTDSPGDFFLGTISDIENERKWAIDLLLGKSTVKFKIDTGADVTVIPESGFMQTGITRMQSTNKELFGPNQAKLSVKGKIRATLRTATSKTTEQDIYIVKKLKEPLLGRPAINALDLIATVEAIQSNAASDMEEEIKAPYPNLFKGLGELDGEYNIKLKPGAIPFALTKPRRIPLTMTKKVHDELTRMEKLGVISKVNIPTDWCAGMVVVPKADGKIRICVDFTKLNEWVLREIYPLPKMRKSFGRNKRIKIFFEARLMPFGIKSAPEHFQKRMKQLLEKQDGQVSIIDDVLIHGKTKNEHDSRLKAVLKKFDNAGVTLNPEKCEFAKKMVKFAGNIVSEDGIQVDPEKIEAVQGMEVPQNWGGAQQKAFEEMKTELSSVPVLAYYDPTKRTVLAADASSYGIGAVLWQLNKKGEKKPVAYASRSMTTTEERYAQIEKEALATTWACEKFNDYLLGMDFVIETDHKPLVPLLGSKILDQLPPRIQRFKMRLMKYSFTIRHIPGKELVVADALSRAPNMKQPTKSDNNLSEDLNIYVAQIVQNIPASERRLEEIRRHQQEDPVCTKLVEFCSEGWPDRNRITSTLLPYYFERATIKMQKGMLMKDSRLIIPSSLRLDILEKIHAGHQGIRKCRERARESVWWPGLSKHIENMVTDCSICCKYRENHAEPLLTTCFPQRPWQKVATDLFEHSGKNYVLVVDYYSRYFEIAPLKKSTTAEDVINHMKSIFSRHGIPETVVTDNGPQYAAAIFSKFAEEWGFTHLTSSPRYPQSNGEAERAVKTAKNLIIKSEDPYSGLLAYRSSPLQNGYSPAELLMGRKLRSNLPVISEKLTQKLADTAKLRRDEESYKRRQAENFNCRHRASVLPDLSPDEKVWVKDIKSPAVVVGKTDKPRSYIVRTEQSVLRRNRKHLIPDPENLRENSELSERKLSFSDKNEVNESSSSLDNEQESKPRKTAAERNTHEKVGGTHTVSSSKRDTLAATTRNLFGPGEGANQRNLSTQGQPYNQSNEQHR